MTTVQFINSQLKGDMDKIYARVPHSTKQVNNSRNFFHKLPETCATNSLLFKSMQFEKERLARISKNSNKNGIYRKIITEKNKPPEKINKTVKEMMPSLSVKTISSKQTDNQMSNLIKQFLTEKHNFTLTQELFLKVISEDKTYGWILKEIKATYDNKLTDLSQKCLQYKTKVAELAKKEINQRIALEHCKTTPSKIKELPSTPLPRKRLNEFVGKLSNSKTPIIKAGKRGVLIPRLDLSKVHNNFEKDKVVYVPAKPRLKNLSTTESQTFHKETAQAKLNRRMDSTILPYKGKISS